MRYIALLTISFILIAAVSSSAKAKGAGPSTIKNQKDSTLTILTYGLMQPSKVKARYETAKKYGFKYEAAAGCLITKKILDNINHHNAKVEAELARRHGVGWKLKFEADVDALYKSMMATQKR